MRAKSAERLLAEQLRRGEGLSYNEISAKTGISKSTLSYWLRDVPLEPGQEQRLQDRLKATRGAFAARAFPVNRKRHAERRQAALESGLDVLNSLPDAESVHKLAFAMLYLGEGTKTLNRVMIGNTQPDIVRYSFWALTRIFGVDTSRITFRLHLIEAAEPFEDRLVVWWSQQLCVPRDRFQKTGYDRRPRQVQISDDYHGVCTIQCYDTSLQHQILGLAQGYLAASTTNEKQKRPTGAQSAGGPGVGGIGLEPTDLLHVKQAL